MRPHALQNNWRAKRFRSILAIHSLTHALHQRCTTPETVRDASRDATKHYPLMAIARWPTVSRVQHWYGQDGERKGELLSEPALD
jgi:hypothetical protein